MPRPPELPARRVLAALARAGFHEARRRGSHRLLLHEDGRSLLFAGPTRLLAKVLEDARISPRTVPPSGVVKVWLAARLEKVT